MKSNEITLQQIIQLCILYREKINKRSLRTPSYLTGETTRDLLDDSIQGKFCIQLKHNYSSTKMSIVWLLYCIYTCLYTHQPRVQMSTVYSHGRGQATCPIDKYTQWWNNKICISQRWWCHKPSARDKPLWSSSSQHVLYISI